MKTNLQTLTVAVAAAAVLLAYVTAQANETDDRIVASARNTYVFRTYLKNDAIKTQSKDGMVTLTGTVAEDSHKSLAQETVAGLPGVKHVDNQLVVKEKPPVERSDAWLATKVRSTLMFHRNVSASKTEVSVNDGVVVLKGEAESEAQKELTTAYAKDIEGVRDVHNQMTVAKVPGAPPTLGERIDDASITAQVKMSLATHHSTSALKTKVETRDGVVTITGVAQNEAEKSLVTKLVTDIKGVKTVINKMVVVAGVTQK